MTSGNIESTVIEVLQAVQTSSGEPYMKLGPDDKPIETLDGFDSLTGIEATVMLEERIGYTIERDSIFVSEDGSQAATLAEICRHLEELSGSEAQAVA